MNTDWIIDVLQDLKTFALANGLTETAVSAEATLAIARAEIASKGARCSAPPKQRAH